MLFDTSSKEIGGHCARDAVSPQFCVNDFSEILKDAVSAASAI